MSINTESSSKVACQRRSFNLAPAHSDGIVLSVHHTLIVGQGTSQRVRYLHASFNCTGSALAASNHLGNVYVFDLTVKKYWFLVHVNCSIIKFMRKINTVPRDALFVGATTGDIQIYNSYTGENIANLLGHKNPVNDISFSETDDCVTLATNEAILWNMKTFTKLHVLHLEEGTILKFVMFVPVSNDVLACFNDETVQIWKAKTYDPIKQIGTNTGGSFNKLTIRSIAFTSNGKLMVVVGHAPSIYVFSIETLQLIKEVSFIHLHLSVKKAQFLPNPFDDGVNKILSFLTSSGVLYFYDMQSEEFISKINMDEEVWKYAVDPSSNHIATISRCGLIQIHSMAHVLPRTNRERNLKIISRRNNYKTKQKTNKKLLNDVLKKQLSDVLDTEKLRAILKEFGEYPSLYRKVIWRNLLQLPNDEEQYAAILSNNYENAFNEFEKHYPLVVKQDMKSLKQFYENLISWCPFLSVVSYLPVLIFPFVKFLQTEPVLCFETLMTIIVNYCQYWFEYHPVPPLNILGLVESIIMQEDPALMEHFYKNEVTSKTYAWFILQSMFSEVLSSSQWLVFCDHLIANDAVFLTVAVAAYSLANKSSLMALENIDDFECFFRTNSTFNFKRFIARCYKLLNNKTIENHPRLFLKPLIPFHNGEYPVFDQFPKNCLEVCESINNLRTEVNSLKQEEQCMNTKVQELQHLKELERSSEEFFRHAQLNKLYSDKLEEEQNNVRVERKRLKALISQAVKNEEELKKSTPQVFQNIVSNKKQTKNDKYDSKREFSRIEEDLLEHYTNLLKYKIQIEGLIDEDVSLDSVQLKKSYKEISDEINKAQARMEIPSKEYLKQLNVVTGLAAVNSLIRKVETRISEKGKSQDMSKTKYVVSKLASESEGLSQEINKLMGLLAHS